MDEKWKDIPGYKGLYQVSNLGRVKSFIHWNGTNIRILKPGQDTHGYLVVNLYRQKKRRFTYIHKMVLETFVGLCPKGMECRHLNDNCRDNRLDNLRWGTRSENLLDRSRNGISNTGNHKGSKNQMAKLVDGDIIEIRRLLTKEHLTQKEVGKIFGITSGAVSLIKCGKRWKHVQ